jgi:hypothetical protein
MTLNNQRTDKLQIPQNQLCLHCCVLIQYGMFPLGGKHIPEVDRKVITYTFRFRTDGGATEMTSKLAELEVLQEECRKIEKLNVSDNSLFYK